MCSRRANGWIPWWGGGPGCVLQLRGTTSWSLKSPLIGSDLKLAVWWCHWLDSMIGQGYGTYYVIATSWVKPHIVLPDWMMQLTEFSIQVGPQAMFCDQMGFQVTLCNQLGLQAVIQHWKELQFELCDQIKYWLSSAFGWGCWLGSTVRWDFHIYFTVGWS